MGYKGPLNPTWEPTPRRCRRRSRGRSTRPKELTEDEQLEKEDLLKEGFSNWSKRDSTGSSV